MLDQERKKIWAEILSRLEVWNELNRPVGRGARANG